jgi:hypothetical protein
MSSTGASTTTTSLSNTPNLISIIITVAGVLATTIGLGVQFSVLNNGPSGDNMIMNNMRTYGAVIGTSISCVFVGLLMWKLLNQSSKSFLWLFVITWISYLLANMAIMFSLYQVELKKQ